MDHERNTGIMSPVISEANW